MRKFAKILDLTPKQIGQALFDRLLRTFPENNMQTPNGIWLKILVSTEDPRLTSALKELQNAGFITWQDRHRPKKANEFNLQFYVEYERSDHESAPYLMPFAPAKAWLGHFEEETNGRICFQCESPADMAALTHEVVGLAGDADRMLVSARVKGALEGARLEHLIFREVLCREYEDPAPWPGQPYWELTSDLVLPPLLPALPPKWDRPQPEERHFRRADLAGIPGFGLALAPDPGAGKRKFLIASKDFYRFCVELGLEMDWVPVRVDN